MLTAEDQEKFEKGIEAVNRGDTPAGLLCLESLFGAEPGPAVASYYAVCLAKERGEVERGVALCREAMDVDLGNPVHYLNLGRVLKGAGLKREAIKVFRDGLLYGKNPLIRAELDSMGWRHPPLIPWLERENPVNKYLGVIFHRVGLRC